MGWNYQDDNAADEFSFSNKFSIASIKDSQRGSKVIWVVVVGHTFSFSLLCHFLLIQWDLEILGPLSSSSSTATT
ncbi:LOW QUALITY PROTEIN: hypothetical protein TorRG33x02_046620 [Trema orientale]|uniref:Uncharacterized protein n=1 Tax=Trema orientale TaxID=63057 RepID=A0A2P5FNX2_TREOI|nr:LOW QUALITY PROTEIN: hypothetical protein TorRG33x02_046620 [Trema orientale]